MKKGEGSDSLVFQTLGWFNSETWTSIKPNHAEQTDFQEVKDLILIGGMDVHIYRIELTHTKPAAEQDPNWSYKEIRWYIAIKEKGRAYGFYFSTESIDDSTMKTVLDSFRLKN